MAQTWEAVAWDPAVVHDQRRYGKLKGLLRKSLPFGIRRVDMNLLKSHRKRITITTIPSNAKFINAYTFLGLMIYVPKATTNAIRKMHVNSPITDTEIGAQAHATFTIQCKYNERNPEFHMAKV